MPKLQSSDWCRFAGQALYLAQRHGAGDITAACIGLVRWALRLAGITPKG